MSESVANLKIWESVEKTDPDFTKDFSGTGGFSGTAINQAYNFKKATKMFGPIGIGWGYDILEERYDSGAPLRKYNKDGSLIPDIDGIEMRAVIHTIKLNFWYIDPDSGVCGEFVHYGHTPHVYMNKWGYQTDDNAPKKSLTDAIGKALSMLGFSSDVFMGLFDDPSYVDSARLESSIEKAEDVDEALAEKMKEFGDWAKKELKAYPLIPNMAALKSTMKHHLKKLERQCQVLGININQARVKFDEAYKKQEEALGAGGVVCEECGTTSNGTAGSKCKEADCSGLLIKITGEKK